MIQPFQLDNLVRQINEKLQELSDRIDKLEKAAKPKLVPKKKA